MERICTEPQLLQVTNRGVKIFVTCSYPKENPPDSLDSVTSCLRYVGAFEDIQDVI